MNRFVSLLTAASFFVAGFSSSTAQTVNDNNTPLHLMKPAYKLRYGISKPEEVKAVIDIDSPIYNRFTIEDKKNLEEVAEILATLF